jgi:branched-subunit amino acid ABC-type transport system permease component
MTGLGVVAGLFATGLVLAFRGTRVRGRPWGLGVMAGSATLALLLAAPRQAAGWWSVAAAGLTLAAMIAFAIGLARRLPGDPPATLDDERW